MKLATSIFITSLIRVEGYLSTPPQKGNPSLTEYGQAQTGILLNVALDIPEDTNDKHSSRLCIDGLKLELQTEPAVTMDMDGSGLKNRVVLPGVETNPLASTGSLGLHIHSDGRFVSMKGQQTVRFEQACWEMCWMENSPDGSFIFGFHLANDACRNGAVLPSGQVYLAFSVFTQESIDVFERKRLEYATALKGYFDRQAQELQEMKETGNWISKAIHFKNAVDAYDSITSLKTKTYDSGPTMDTVLMSIGNSLLLSTKGSVFIKNSSGKKDNPFTLLGYASLKY